MKQAFTLIELLVVILIIGILATVAVPQYQKAVWKSRYIQAKTLAKQIANAQEVYFMANGKYSPSLEDLDISLPATSFTADGKFAWFNWGYCEITANNEVDCRLRKNGEEYLIYLLGFEHSASMSNKSVCVAVSKNRSDINYQVCVNETNNANDVSWGGTTTGFYYP